VGYAPIGGFGAVDYGSPLLGTFAIPGSQVRLSLRRETAPLHVALAAAWHAEVEPLIPGQCWGHAYRAVRGATTTSYHAVGNAMDLNSAKHPLGVHPTFSARQVAAARRVLARFRHEGEALYRWGYDYTGRKDDMHVELVADRPLALRAVAALQTPRRPSTTPIQEDYMATVPQTQWDEAYRWIKATGPVLATLIDKVNRTGGAVAQARAELGDDEAHLLAAIAALSAPAPARTGVWYVQQVGRAEVYEVISGRARHVTAAEWRAQGLTDDLIRRLDPAEDAELLGQLGIAV
jgi:hypothetical protein